MNGYYPAWKMGSIQQGAICYADSAQNRPTIIEQIKVLPPERLDDLASYVEFLHFKARSTKAPPASSEKLRVVNLRGLLAGYDFSPEFLAEAR